MDVTNSPSGEVSDLSGGPPRLDDEARPPLADLLSDLLCFDLYSMSRAMTGLYRPLLEPLGLTYPQFLVLTMLLRHGPGTIRDVGESTRLDHGTLTPLLRRLASRGTVRMSRGVDARTVLVSLTPVGERLRPQVQEIHCGIRDAVGLTDAELEQLQGGLQRLALHLDGRVRPD